MSGERRTAPLLHRVADLPAEAPRWAPILVILHRAFGLRLWSGLRWPEWGGTAWFNLGIGCLGLSLPYYVFHGYGLTLFPWNAFRRWYEDGARQGGFGVVQLGRRHLLYTGWSQEPEREREWRMCVAFVWLVGGAE